MFPSGVGRDQNESKEESTVSTVLIMISWLKSMPIWLTCLSKQLCKMIKVGLSSLKTSIRVSFMASLVKTPVSALNFRAAASKQEARMLNYHHLNANL